eukprot:s2452_g4.t2
MHLPPPSTRRRRDGRRVWQAGLLLCFAWASRHEPCCWLQAASETWQEAKEVFIAELTTRSLPEGRVGDVAAGKVWFNLAVAQQSRGAPDAALRSYERARGRDPDHRDAPLNEALLLAKRATPEAVRRARGLLKAALGVDPRSPGAWWNLGLLEAYEGDPAANHTLDKALDAVQQQLGDEDVLCELLQFSDDSVWQAMRDLRPEDMMRLHDLMGSAFAHPFKLTPLRFTHPPPDVEMNDSGRGRGSNDVPTEVPIMWDGCVDEKIVVHPASCTLALALHLQSRSFFNPQLAAESDHFEACAPEPLAAALAAFRWLPGEAQWLKTWGAGATANLHNAKRVETVDTFGPDTTAAAYGETFYDSWKAVMDQPAVSAVLRTNATAVVLGSALGAFESMVQTGREVLSQHGLAEAPLDFQVGDAADCPLISRFHTATSPSILWLNDEVWPRELRDHVKARAGWELPLGSVVVLAFDRFACLLWAPGALSSGPRVGWLPARCHLLVSSRGVSSLEAHLTCRGDGASSRCIRRRLRPGLRARDVLWTRPS